MNPKPFAVGLSILLCAQILMTLLLLYLVKALQPHLLFLFISIITLSGFCVSVYWAARNVVRSNDARLYIQLIMVAVFLKLLLCIALVIIYKQVFNPVNHTFLWPFLFIYISSTIYEVIFLEKVGRQKNKTVS
jgi:hypothetical protein